MDEKGKSYWRPPEVPKLVPPMPDFDDFPISAWLKTPPIPPFQNLDQFCEDHNNNQVNQCNCDQWHKRTVGSASNDVAALSKILDRNIT